MFQSLINNGSISEEHIFHIAMMVVTLSIALGWHFWERRGRHKKRQNFDASGIARSIPTGKKIGLVWGGIKFKIQFLELILKFFAYLVLFLIGVAAMLLVLFNEWVQKWDILWFPLLICGIGIGGLRVTWLDMRDIWREIIAARRKE